MYSGGASSAQQVPWRSIYTAVGLLVAGLALFISGMALWRTEGTNAFIGLFVLGLLVFIPGLYFTRIAYLAYKGRAGYSWADIPEFQQ